VLLAPTAGRQPLPKAGATQERTLEAVVYTRLLRLSKNPKTCKSSLISS
jgi:hypothetical protein